MLEDNKKMLWIQAFNSSNKSNFLTFRIEQIFR